jgi:hypothetical protein
VNAATRTSVSSCGGRVRSSGVAAVSSTQNYAAGAAQMR